MFFHEPYTDEEKAALKEAIIDAALDVMLNYDEPTNERCIWETYESMKQASLDFLKNRVPKKPNDTVWHAIGDATDYSNT